MWKVYSADVHDNIVAMEIAWKQAPFICKTKRLFLLHQTTFIVMHIYTNIRTHTDNTEIQIRPPLLLVCSRRDGGAGGGVYMGIIIYVIMLYTFCPSLKNNRCSSE